MNSVLIIAIINSVVFGFSGDKLLGPGLEQLGRLPVSASNKENGNTTNTEEMFLQEVMDDNAELAGLSAIISKLEPKLKPKNHVGLRNTTTKTSLSEAEAKTKAAVKKTKMKAPGIGEGMIANIGGAAAGNIMNAAAPFIEKLGFGGITDAMCFVGFGDCDPAPDNTEIANMITGLGTKIDAVQEDIDGLTEDVKEMDGYLREVCREFRQDFIDIKGNQEAMKEQLKENFDAIEEGFTLLKEEVDVMGKRLEASITHNVLGNDCNDAAHQLEWNYNEYIHGQNDLARKLPRGKDDNFGPYNLELSAYQNKWIAKENWLQASVGKIESCLAPIDSSAKGYFESYYHFLKTQQTTPKFKLAKLADAFEFYMGSLIEADEMLYTAVFCRNRHDYTFNPSSDDETNRQLNAMNAHFKAVRTLSTRWGFRLDIIRAFWKWAEQIFTDAAFTCRLGFMDKNWDGTYNLCSTLQTGDCPNLQEFAKYWQYLPTRWPQEWTRPQKSLASFGISTVGACWANSYWGAVSCYDYGRYVGGSHYYKAGSRYKAIYCHNSE